VTQDVIGGMDVHILPQMQSKLLEDIHEVIRSAQNFKQCEKHISYTIIQIHGDFILSHHFIVDKKCRIIATAYHQFI
jgi:hypothetical protein